MSDVFEHIVQELDSISRQEQLALRDILEVKLASMHPAAPPSSPTNGASVSTDPLEGIRIPTGINDLAERFDDYRFGRKTR